MTMTRRELLIAAAAAPAALVPGSQPAPASNLAPPAHPAPAEHRKMMLADIPDDLYMARWQHEYRVRYAKDHAPPPYLRGAAAQTEFVSEIEYDATTMKGAIDTLARLEAEVPSDPPISHTAIAIACGEGFAARRDGKAAADNPYWKAPELGLMSESESDLFMSWHAGYVQADPNLVLPLSPGYTPPPVDCCQVCGHRWKTRHRSGCHWIRSSGNSRVLKRQTRLKS